VIQKILSCLRKTVLNEEESFDLDSAVLGARSRERKRGIEREEKKEI
jgi:hypothetical protein